VTAETISEPVVKGDVTVTTADETVTAGPDCGFVHEWC
jgi:hypothetical protein